MKTNRRKFIQGIAGASAGLILPASCTTNSKKESASSEAPAIHIKNKPIKASHDVIVVGAGLSGLHAAMLLEESGYDVQVIEGRQRLGGRVYTLLDVPGKPEAAGEYIGANYARMISTVNKLGLEMYNPEGGGNNRPWLYNIKGNYIDAKNWESHKLNPLEGEDRTLLPHRFLSTISHRDNPLSGKPLDAWLEPEFHKYDIPHDQYLRSKGVNEETIRLMNVVIHSGGMHRTSAINELRRYHVMHFSSGKISFPDGTNWKMVKGGNSLLPEAMAGSLKNEPHLGKTVVGFKEENGIVQVSCADGSEYRGKHIICSIPISVLRNVTFEPHISGVTKEAIDQMDYGLSVQAHFLVKEPFWEKDGMEANMWTDGPLERFAVRTKRNKTDPDAAIAYINGPESNKFRLMTDDQVFNYVEMKLAEMRPSTKGALERLIIQSCERDVHGAGDWVYWQPGQVKKFANHMRNNHGNIHFCGEHTSIMERGMEGAFESGERAALDIILNA
ncbi:monoamine oxidase [Maribacter vaceletii]|uniref:Monoamine oxidase n=1 Tax=Maribacter vaceletii TaxID=1206816 RepID=A0A495EER8_9FLAO|nr:NAD(P)/FAD-dependent oxidoreductase [Maribacter vaceletii]RKR15256.1 monoamine oxidase [Maribacter vaceletii]